MDRFFWAISVFVFSFHFPYYTHQGGYVFVIVCLSVSNFALKLRTNLHEIFNYGWQ